VTHHQTIENFTGIKVGELPIEIYIAGQHIGNVEPIAHQTIGNMHEWIVRVDRDKYVRAYTKATNYFCYSCGRVVDGYNDTHFMAISICQECLDETRAWDGGF
jgi:hypothetical protein